MFRSAKLSSTVQNLSFMNKRKNIVGVEAVDRALNILNCLGLLEGMCCPHYQEEIDRRPSLHKILKDGEFTFCWAIDGGAAIHFKGGLYFKSLSFYKESYTYKVKKGEKSIMEEKLDSIML